MYVLYYARRYEPLSADSKYFFGITVHNPELYIKPPKVTLVATAHVSHGL